MDGASVRKYHVAHQGRKFGPLSLVELSSLRLSSDMLVWCEGMPEWIPVGDIPELRPYVHHATASHTVAPPTATTVMPTTTASSSVRGYSPVAVPLGSVPSVAPPQPPSPPVASSGKVKFMGISMIVLGTVGLLCCPLSVYGAFVQDMPPDFETRTITAVHAVLYSCMFLVSIPMLIAGIGLLRRRRWAAVTGTVSSIVVIVLNLVTSAFDCGFVQLPYLRIMKEAGSNEEMVGFVIGICIASLATIAGMIVHCVMVFLLNSKSVRQSLR